MVKPKRIIKQPLARFPCCNSGYNSHRLQDFLTFLFPSTTLAIGLREVVVIVVVAAVHHSFAATTTVKRKYSAKNFFCS
jgi:hypothetical protein